MFPTSYSVSSLGPYPYHMTIFFPFRQKPSCPTMQSTLYSDTDVGVLLTITDVFFVCCSCVVRLSLLVEPAVYAVLGQCSFSLGAAVTLCNETVLGTRFSRARLCAFVH